MASSEVYLLLCELLYPSVFVFHLLSQLHSCQIHLDSSSSILSLHLCPHPLQSGQQLLSAGPLVGGNVETLLHQQDQVGVESTNESFQKLDVLNTALQFVPRSSQLRVVRIREVRGFQVTREGLDRIQHATQ